MTIRDARRNFTRGAFNPVFQGLGTSRLGGRGIAAIAMLSAAQPGPAGMA